MLYQVRQVPNARLRSIHERLALFVKLAGFSGTVRMTIHRPIWRKRYQQVINYVPTNEGAHRKFPDTQGIVGKCIADPSHVYIENFPDETAYSTLMVQRYGYSVEQSMKRAIDRRSYYAHPLVRDGKLIAVLFVDSTHCGEFPANRSLEVDGLCDELSREIAELLPKRRINRKM
jgi:hypothetical protein